LRRRTIIALRPGRAEAELRPKLGDGGVKKAAYRGG
jgi:hypothetical protein